MKFNIVCIHQLTCIMFAIVHNLFSISDAIWKYFYVDICLKILQSCNLYYSNNKNVLTLYFLFVQ